MTTTTSLGDIRISEDRSLESALRELTEKPIGYGGIWHTGEAPAIPV